jgi:MFS family permease
MALGVADATVPLLWMTVSAVATLFSAPLSALSDTLGRRRLLVTGYLAYGAVYLALGLMALDGLMLFAIFAAYGIFLAATEGVEKALVADLAPADRRGTAFGWFNLTTGLMLLPASVVFGSLYQGFSALTAFAFSAGCALTAAALLRGWVGLDRADLGSMRGPASSP